MGKVQNGKVKQLSAIYPLENMAVELRGVELATACLTVILLVITHGPLAAAGPGKKSERNKLTAAPEVVEAWQDMRFGMFNCWGPVSLTGLEIGWSRGAPRGGEFRVRKGQGPTPVKVYDNLYKKWKPDKFDARQWVHVNREGIWAEPQSLLKAKIKPNEIHLDTGAVGSHYENFIQCVRSRRDPIAPVEAGHQSSYLGMIAEISIRLGRTLRWDPKAERFVGDDQANRLLSAPMWSPWHL